VPEAMGEKPAPHPVPIAIASARAARITGNSPDPRGGDHGAGRTV
jgi:hypothetical protein